MILGEEQFFGTLMESKCFFRRKKAAVVSTAAEKRSKKFMYYHANNGYSAIIALTFSLTALILASGAVLATGSIAEMTSSIISTIGSIMSSFKPRVVIAGVPIRRPDVRNGERLSNGTMFLFTLMSASTNVFYTVLPVTSGNLVRRSMSMRWLSVPPLMML